MCKNFDTKKWENNVFDLIGKQWMLIGAKGKNEKCNAMTASWGGLGVLWGKNVAFVFVRPQRYTRELIDESSTMTLSFFEDEKTMLGYMGKASGRQEDKLAKCGLTYKIVNEAPVFDKAQMTLVCTKLYKQQMQKDSFFGDEIPNQYFKENDFHIMYVVEIDKIIE